jgi:putative Holliday junction resolvase
MSIDYGHKHIGTALSTPNHTFAMPLQLIIQSSVENTIKEIAQIITNRNICAIVVGLPVNVQGGDNNQSLVVQHFVNSLEQQIILPILLQDERFTSRAANNYLKQFELKRKKRNHLEDLTAASLILETVLNRIANTKF